MRKSPAPRSFHCVLYIFILLSIRHVGTVSARGGWDDPPGGWDYVFEASTTDTAYTFTSGDTSTELLDGPWIGGAETYFWDGSAPGEYDTTDPGGNAPGGLHALTIPGLGDEGGDATVLALEVAGDTTTESGTPYGTAWASPANEAIYFYRATELPDAEDATLSVNKGITVTARWRLAPDPSDLAPLQGKVWNGAGFIDNGKGMISVVDQDEINCSLSFTDTGGLVLMDRYELDYTGDPAGFLSVWICVTQRADSVFLCEIYLNGSPDPVFAQEVEDPPFGDETGSSPDDYIAFGLPVIGEPAAMELDYIGYKGGFIRPGGSIPPPLQLSGTLDTSVEPIAYTLSWTIPEGASYDAIVIQKEGAAAVELQPDATSYTTTDLAFGNNRFFLSARAGAADTVPSTISVDVTADLSPAAIIDYESDPPAARITWSEIIFSAIDAVRVSRNGTFLSELPATATEYIDTALTPAHGEVSYELVLVSGGEAVSDPFETGRIAIFTDDTPYLDPEGGWNYIYNPDLHNPELHPMDLYVAEKGIKGALDGMWIRSVRTDYWDGSSPGVSTSPDDPDPIAPGGIEILTRETEGLNGEAIQTLSIEDPGDPRQDDYVDPSNRKLYFAYPLDPPPEPLDGGRLAAGITLYARFRLTPDPKDVSDAPNGEPSRDSNRGQIMLVFYDGDPDNDETTEQSKSWGMSLDGSTLDVTDGGDIHGLKPGEWVSVWVTLEDADESGFYHNHLFINGNTVPIRPDWRSELDGWEETIYSNETIQYTALCMGLLSTGEDGAIEIDFIKIKYGEHFPESAFAPPPPASFSCSSLQTTITLSWENTDAYNTIEIYEGNSLLASVPGDTTSYTITDAGEGTHDYRLEAQKDLFAAEPVQCSVEVTPDAELFIRGDPNQDGSQNIADAVFILTYYFSSGQAPECPDAADHNDDGDINIADVVFMLSFLFAEGDDFPAPGDGCGPDPTDDALPPCTYPPTLCR